ncbi:hypothetical protein BCR42DRAFT_391239 [Absidia repens]|uniref:Uncharacterized protein n=1 Tax=Absidia repens TaxID=90262 RepID=A0A1X2IJG8_9FUNG|nr:hypothetical protein BCR42DRAFT_391239 [Absidia repens]
MSMDEKSGLLKLKIITLVSCVIGIVLLGYWGFYCQSIPSPTLLSIFFKSSRPAGSVDGIGISPKVIFQTDWTHCVMIIIYVVMVLDFRADIFIKCFLLLLGFSTVQLIQNIWSIIDRESFLKEQLSRAWQMAYEQDPRTLEQMEDRWKCSGFYHSEDRSLHSSNNNTMVLLQGCHSLVVNQFGDMIYQWAILLLLIKCVQIIFDLGSLWTGMLRNLFTIWPIPEE